MVRGGADIQTENGFVKIHPKILELLALADLTVGELKCVLFLLRKTYGWGKKHDTLSYQQIADGTNLSRRGVIGAMQSLIDKNVILVSETKLGRKGCRTYGFNKYYEKWSGVVNGESPFTIYEDTNGEPSCTIQQSNGEQPFTNNGEMVNGGSLEMVNGGSPTIDNKETIGIKDTGGAPPTPTNGYFGLPRPFNSEHVTADSFIKDAAKEGVDAPTFVSMSNLLIDAAGWKALIDNGDDNKLRFAKQDTAMLIKLGVKSIEELQTLLAAYRAAFPNRTAPQPRNISEYASQLLQGVAPSANGNHAPKSKVQHNLDMVDDYYMRKNNAMKEAAQHE